MAILQVRDIDEKLYSALKFSAKQQRRSISQEVVKILETHFSTPSKPAQDQTEAFLTLCGSWEGRESAKEIIEDIRASRRNGKRFGETDGLPD